MLPEAMILSYLCTCFLLGYTIFPALGSRFSKTPEAHYPLKRGTDNLDCVGLQGHLQTSADIIARPLPPISHPT